MSVVFWERGVKEGGGRREGLVPRPQHAQNGRRPGRSAVHAPLVTTKLLPTGIRWKTWLNLSGWLSPSVCCVVLCL